MQHWRIVHVTFNILPSTNITNLFENWLNGIAKKIKLKSEWVFVLYFEPYGMCIIIMCLANLDLLFFCRLNLWPRTGSAYGHLSSRKSVDRIWILGAALWNGCTEFIISMAGLGSLIIGYHVDVYVFHLNRCFSLIDTRLNLIWSISCKTI